MRSTSLFYADGRPKQLPLDRRGGFDSYLQSIGQANIWNNFSMMILEVVPQQTNESNTEWQQRARKYEQWWIHYLGSGINLRGWNIDHTLAAKGFGRVRASSRKDEMLQKAKTKKRSKPMIWARRRNITSRRTQAMCYHITLATTNQENSRERTKPTKRRHKRRQAQKQKRNSINTLKNLEEAFQCGQLQNWSTKVKLQRILRALPLARQKATAIDAREHDKQRWRLALQVVRRQRATLPPTRARPLIVCNYMGKAMEMIQLSKLMSMTDIDSLLPPAVSKLLGNPLVVYKYHTPLLQLVCNWAQASRSMGADNSRCTCIVQPRFQQIFLVIYIRF